METDDFTDEDVAKQEKAFLLYEKLHGEENRRKNELKVKKEEAYLKLQAIGIYSSDPIADLTDICYLEKSHEWVMAISRSAIEIFHGEKKIEDFPKEMHKDILTKLAEEEYWIFKQYSIYSDEKIEKYIVHYQECIQRCKKNLAGLCHDRYKETMFLESDKDELRKLLKVKELRKRTNMLKQVNTFLKTYEG